MKYLTAIYFTLKKQGDFVIHFDNPYTDVHAACAYTRVKEKEVIKQYPKAELMRAHTFEFGMRSFDMR